MKIRFWSGYGLLAGALLTGAAPIRAQSLAGTWQGVEAEKGDPRHWPAVLRVQAGQGTSLFGVLYQEVGGQPEISVTFQMQGTRTGSQLRLDHVRKLTETGSSPFSYWCDGSIAFTYDPALEKLTGHAAYDPVGDCDTGEFTLYRVKLKSAATVPAAVATNLRVSGRDVRWFADAELKQPLATGNIYHTKLSKATTFYITQGYYPSVESAAVPITIQVKGGKPARPARPAPPVASAPATPPPAPAAAPTPPDTRPGPPRPARPFFRPRRWCCPRCCLSWASPSCCPKPARRSTSWRPPCASGPRCACAWPATPTAWANPIKTRC